MRGAAVPSPQTKPKDNPYNIGL
ncbi:unnamed protein product, partial [Rotaria sp. Silwood1]